MEKKVEILSKILDEQSIRKRLNIMRMPKEFTESIEMMMLIQQISLPSVLVNIIYKNMVTL